LKGESRVKYCGVYLRGEAIYVIVSFKNHFGVVVKSDSIVKLGRDAPPDLLGASVLDALRLFREGVPMPDTPRAGVKALLAVSGIKSWGAFLRGASYVSVSHEGNEVSFTPSYLERGSFMFMPDKTTKSPPQPPAVGEALLEAFKLCR
jgi:hypothetical protein